MEITINNITEELIKVSNPASYLPLELNLKTHDFEDRCIRFILTYPDLYEVGFSHTGTKIIYHILNNILSFTLCHRAYLPRPDMQELMKKKQIPLYSLEALRPVKDYDIWGFTLQSELTYTNLLQCIKLAKLPLKREERKDFPVIIAGGPCAFNPVPLSPFVDAFVIGDGEEIIPEMAKILKEMGKDSKEDFLNAIKCLDGVWIPKFGKYPVKKVTFRKLSEDAFPTNYPVPSIKVIHDRISIEAARGCLKGCRFCQAGYIYRPYRERTAERIVEILKKCYKSSGYEEVSLSALSISDHSEFNIFMPEVLKFCATNQISVSLPSLRIDSFSTSTLKAIMSIKETGITIAPEVATAKMKRVINKDIKNEDVIKACEEIFATGWKKLKFYFLIGLPFENDEDVLSIAKLLKEIYNAWKKYRTSKKLIVGISTFIPKPFTPFQWESFSGIKEAKRKMRIIKNNIPKIFDLRFHDPRKSFIEALLSRGDETSAQILETALQNGCQLDEWNEYFNWNAWENTVIEYGINSEESSPALNPEQELPWDFIQGPITKKFLLKERDKAYKQEWTKDCRIYGCYGCGACSTEEISKIKLYKPPEKAFPWNKEIETDVKKQNFTRRIAFVFEKKKSSKYLSINDLNRTFIRTFRKFNLPIRYRGKFNPRPYISIPFGLPVGVEAEGDIVEVEVMKNIDIKSFLQQANKFLPEGLKFTGFLFTKEKPIKEMRKTIRYTIISGDKINIARVHEINNIATIKPNMNKISVEIRIKNGSAPGLHKVLSWLGLNIKDIKVTRHSLLDENLVVKLE